MAGEGENGPRLEQLAHDLDLGDRVSFPRRLTDEQLVEHLARCRAVVFAPQQEDYGFVTTEAFAASRPVITCRDSGGPAELVRDGENGFVVDPTPQALAAALARVMDSRDTAARLGRQAHVDGARLTWDAAVERLMSA